MNLNWRELAIGLVVSCAVSMAVGYSAGRIHEARVGQEAIAALERSYTDKAFEATEKNAETIKTMEAADARTRTAFHVSFDRLTDRLRAAESRADGLRRSAAAGHGRGVPEVPAGAGGVQGAVADAGPAAAGGIAGCEADAEPADTGLAARCAVTTHQCAHFGAWLDEQIAIFNGEQHGHSAAHR